MLGRCTVCYGGVLYGRAVWYCITICIRTVYCVLGRCTLWYGSALYVRMVILRYGGGLCDMVVYMAVLWCTVRYGGVHKCVIGQYHV